MSEPTGWQHDTKGKRLYMEVRNESDLPLYFEIVRVRATNNYFIYVRDEREPKDTLVNGESQETIEIQESDF